MGRRRGAGWTLAATQVPAGRTMAPASTAWTAGAGPRQVRTFGCVCGGSCSIVLVGLAINSQFGAFLHTTPGLRAGSVLGRLDDGGSGVSDLSGVNNPTVRLALALGLDPLRLPLFGGAGSHTGSPAAGKGGMGVLAASTSTWWRLPPLASHAARRGHVGSFSTHPTALCCLPACPPTCLPGTPSPCSHQGAARCSGAARGVPLHGGAADAADHRQPPAHDQERAGQAAAEGWRRGWAGRLGGGWKAPRR